MKNFFTDKSKCTFIAAVFAVIYMIYIISSLVSSMSSPASVAEVLGGAVAIAILIPHMLLFGLGMIFNWVSVFTKKPWAALTAGILYSVSTLMFIPYSMFTIVPLVLAFVGYSKQKKTNNSVGISNSEKF